MPEKIPDDFEKIFFELSPNLLVVVDLEGRILAANDAWTRVLGWTKKEVLGKIISEFWHPDDRESTILEADRVRRGERSREFANRYRNKDGAWCWMRWSSVLYQERLIFGVGRDFSEQREIESRLGKNEAFVDAVLDSIPAVVFVKDLEGRYLLVNRYYESLFQVDRQRFLGKTDYDVFPADFADQFRRNDLEVLSARAPIYTEETAPHRDGSVHNYISVKFPLNDEQNEPYAVCGVATDVSDLKRTEHKLQHSEQQLKTLFDLSPAGIALVDAEGVIIDANPSFLKLLDYASSEVVGRPFYDFCVPDARDADRAQFARLLAKGRIDSFEREYVRKNGSLVSVEVRAVIFKESSGRTLLWTLLEDLTQRKERESERERLISKVINTSKLATLGEMAGGIAHEINNPLAIILGKADYLKTRVLGSGVDKATLANGLETVAATAERIAKIVRGLRAFSRNAEQDSFATIPVSRLIEETLGLCQERFRAQGIEVRVEKVVDCQIECRSVQLSQVLLNILNNAYDAVESVPDKWVSISTEERDGWLRMRIMDNGTGVPKEIVSKLMQPFFTTKGVGKGTGLGLSIASGIVEEHEGRLWFDPQSPKTCFVIDLPLKSGG